MEIMNVLNWPGFLRRLKGTDPTVTERRYGKPGLLRMRQALQSSIEGEMVIRVLEGGNEILKPGDSVAGFCPGFQKDIPIVLEHPDGSYYKGGVIEGIDWEKGTFHTIQTTYGFHLCRGNSSDKLASLLELMREDLAYYENKYQGRFAEKPHVGLGNRKTRCVNEATLPIITCHPSCVGKCAGTCYVINTMTYPRPTCRRCQARNTVLRRIDPAAYYGHFFAEAERMGLPVRLSDGGDFENTEQVKACFQAAEKHPSVQAIGYTKRIELLDVLKDAPANVHIRYSAWEGDEENTQIARGMGFGITHVVTDGSGNCPYQNSLARYRHFKNGKARELRAQGLEVKAAGKEAEKLADQAIKVHHCRDCAAKLCGCCAQGSDIRFNEVH